MFAGGLRVPESKRGLFKRPLGVDISESELKTHSKRMLITVGDVVSLTARNLGLRPYVSIYDGYTERREMTGFAALVEDEGGATVTVENPPGEISRGLVVALADILGTGGTIEVVGEEDLAVVPCVLMFPEGTEIVYGWPGVGMKVLVIDGDIVQEMNHLINEMEEVE